MTRRSNNTLQPMVAQGAPTPELGRYDYETNRLAIRVFAASRGRMTSDRRDGLVFLPNDSFTSLSNRCF